MTAGLWQWFGPKVERVRSGPEPFRYNFREPVRLCAIGHRLALARRALGPIKPRPWSEFDSGHKRRRVESYNALVAGEDAKAGPLVRSEVSFQPAGRSNRNRIALSSHRWKQMVVGC